MPPFSDTANWKPLENGCRCFIFSQSETRKQLQFRNFNHQRLAWRPLQGFQLRIGSGFKGRPVCSSLFTVQMSWIGNMMRNSEGFFFLFGIFSSMAKNGRDASHQIRRYRQFLHQKIRITRRICLRKQTQMQISRIWTIRRRNNRRRSTTFWKKPAWIWSCNPRQAITKVFVLWTRSNPHCKEPKNGPWRKNKPLILRGRPLSLHLRLHLQALECSQQAALAACFM